MKILRSYIVILLILLCAAKASASHIFGGDLLYQYVGNDRYRVVLTIYGDCSGQNFPTLKGASPSIILQNNGQAFAFLSLMAEDSGVEVTPVCVQDSNNTACKRPTNPLPGITRYIYADTVTVPFPAADWVFAFSGIMGNNSIAGRTNAIGNINIDPALGSVMYLEAHLNNLNGPNNSPVYTTIPTPFYCVNLAQEYNQGAVDPDKDSLNFLLTPALESSVQTVTYIPPYSATAPIATAAGSFSFNNINGQMSFTPNLAQISVVVNKVEEYKNSVLVGSSMREMTFIVLNTCNNSPPVGKIDSNVDGGLTAPGNIVNVCQGTKHIAFTISPKDANGDNITVDTSGGVFGGALTITGNGTKSPKISFSWDPDANQPLGAYTFFLKYKDNGCPLSSNQTIAYTVRVIRPFSISYEVLAPTQCAHNAYVRITVKDGVSPKVLEVDKNDRVLKSYSDSLEKNDTTYIIADSFMKGNYHLVAFSPYFKCISDFYMTIADSGVYPYPPFFKDKEVCLNDSVVPISFNVDTTVFHINWYDNEAGKLATAPTYATNTTKVYTWQISQTHLVCESDKVPYHVNVHDLPTIDILAESRKVCIGDKIFLLASGGVSYTWLPADKIYSDDRVNFYTRVLEPTTYKVVGTSEYGCVDTASITYSDVENCCTFSYPNAFTPNGDGKNDRFRPLLYGNSLEYSLTVYNRWGQEVFHTTDPNDSWDGNYNSKPCEMGVYYYRLKSKCYTGHEETSAGDVTLIR